ncbi:MAG: carboxypeptidase-like regulatory domain-containing protein, partial [Pyrinomonadaceae bacterium]
LYMSANMFDCLNASCSSATYQEVRAYGLNIQDLISGATLRSIVVDTNSTARFTLLPSNFRGTAPPAGRPNYFVGESSTLFAWEVFRFHVDYVTPASSTFTGPTNVAQASYVTAATTVPEPAPGNATDTLAERMMMQNQYRIIGGVESLWVNHTVGTAAAATPTGIQWGQINVTGNVVNTTPVQQQIFNNGADGLNRFMGAIAVDRVGNMAIGYTASSAAVAPDIRYAGRLSTDPLNTLPQTEVTMLPSVTRSVQTGTCGGICTRWGDYSAMSIDPVDECTFWYTHHFFPVQGTNWVTRIGSFKFPSCVPTAAPVAISGRVLRPDGEGLSGVTITLNEGIGQRMTVTNTKGAYVFENVPVGTFCVLTATRKGYVFNPENISFEAFSNAEGTFNGTPTVREINPGRPFR